MERNDPLLRRVRAAYELGRLKAALGVAAFTLPMLALTLACGGPVACWCLGLGLWAAVAALVWRGEGFGAGAVHGLIGGLVPFMGGFAMRFGLHVPSQHCGTCELPFSACFGGAFAGGLVAGVLLALRLRKVREHWRARAIGSAVVVCALAGSLGCAFFGAVGVLGICVGVTLVGAPIVILHAARSAA